MPVSLIELVAGLVITAAGAVVQGTIGLGFAVVSVPLLSLINPIMAPVPQLLLAAPLSMSMAWRERSDIHARGAVFLMLGRIPGALLGLALLAVATQTTLDIGIALSVLVAVMILGAGLTVARNPATEFGTGIIAGTMGMVASIGGPAAALLFKDERGPVVRATLAAFFSFGLVITIIGRVLAGRITGDDVTIALLLSPGMVAGYLASSRLKSRIDAGAVRPAILVIASLAAIGLLIRAMWG
jgi:uncharacterized membrane protein YfcA